MIQNSKEQHKDILCLISLSNATRQQMKENGYDLDEAIKELKAIDNVDVGDITMQTISTIFRYKLVIIICHHVRKSNIDALELSDNTLLPVESFVNAVVNAVNNRYTGLIDLGICDSEHMAKSIKSLSQYPDLYRIQYVEEDTGVEFRLCYIYPKLLQYFSFDSIKDYRIRYRESFLEAIEKAKKDQKEEIEDVSSLPEGTKLGGTESSEDIATSVFAPKEVKATYKFPIQVFLYFDAEKGTLVAKAKAEGVDPDTKPRLIQEPLTNIHAGDVIDVKLSMLDVDKQPSNSILVFAQECTYTKQVIIDQKETKVSFDVKVTEDYLYEECWAKLIFMKGENEKISFDPFKIKIKLKKDRPQSCDNTERIFPSIEAKGNREAELPKADFKEDYQNEICKEKQFDYFGGPFNKNCTKLIRVNESSKRRKGRSSHAGEKVTKAFKYIVHERDKEFANERLVKLYKALLAFNWIREDTQQQTFVDLFSGGDCTHRIVWMDDVNTLADLFRRLVSVEKLAAIQSPYGLWQMVDGHFWEKEGNKAFGNERLRKTHTPQEKSRHIDYLVNILNPRYTEQQLKEMLMGEKLEEDEEST